MKILILGAGFVGLHLFHDLKKNHPVTCTVRTLEKQLAYQEQGIPTKIFNLDDLTSYLPVLIDQEIVIIAVSAKDQNYRDCYLKLASNIKKIAHELNSLKQIIVLGTTAVYEESKGNTVQEFDQLNEKEEKPKVLVETENTYLGISRVSCCIFRLGEIYGYERSLERKIHQLASKEIPGDGEQFSNLIHVDDIVSAVNFAIDHNLNGIYNLVCDDHLKRKDLYQTLCKKYACLMPIFNPNRISHHGKNKIVSNEKIKNLGFKLKHPHLLI